MTKKTVLSHASDEAKPIFKKMFDIVGAPHDLEMTDTWYTEYQWTKEQEDSFKDWFIKYHRKKRNKGVVASYARNARGITSAFEWFNLMWGWKRSDG